jgi:HprK-related kinase A
LIVADLAPPDLDRRLRESGLRLRTGPVVTSIRSTLPSVRQGIGLHYAQHRIVEDQGFADFHVEVGRPRTLRRWFHPQVVFHFDGLTPFRPLPGDQGFPMLEWGLNWCVSSHCHQYLIVHAAVLERDGRALVMPAPSGSGKSTLCAGLVYGGGWRLLSDELALIDPARGRIWPLPRPVSLKNASIEVIRALAPTAQFGEVVTETVKGRVVHVQPPKEGVLRADEAAVPAWVVLPRFAAGTAARLQPMSRARAFMQVVDNAFNYHVHGRSGFATVAALIDRSRCFEFTYSELNEAISTFHTLALTDV